MAPRDPRIKGSRREERRLEQAAHAAPVARPEELVAAVAADCPGRMAGHNFSMSTKGPDGFVDERSARVIRCWYCSRLSPFSEQRIAAWRATQSADLR